MCKANVVSDEVLDHGLSVRDLLGGNIDLYRDDQYVTIPIKDLRNIALEFDIGRQSLIRELVRIAEKFDRRNVGQLLEASQAFKNNLDVTGTTGMAMRSVAALLREIRSTALEVVNNS